MKQIFGKFIIKNEIQDILNEETEKIPFQVKLLFNWKTWVSVYFIALVVEIMFIYIGTDFKRNDFHILEAIFTNLAFIVLAIIILLIIYRFFLQFLSLRKNLIEKYSKNYKAELITEKIFKPWKQALIVLASLGMIAFSISKIFIWFFPSYRPMNFYGYTIEGIYYFIDFLMALVLFVAVVGIIDISRFIISYSNEIKKNNKLVIKPTHKDRSGGFLIISLYLFKISLIVSVISGLYILYLYFNGAIRYSLGIYYLLFDLIVLAIIPLITFTLVFLVPQLSYMRILSDYKNDKLKVLYEKKHNLMEKLFQEVTITGCKELEFNSEYNEKLHYYNNLISEIELITDWPFQRRFFVILFTSSIFPIIFFIIEQLLTKYVFNLR